TAPSLADASSTNADDTPAPPDEMSRSDDTADAANEGDPIIAMKNAGGSTMNVTNSRSTSSKASSAFQRGCNTVFMAAAPGTSTPFSNPDTCESGAGMSTASPEDNPCTCTISRAL